MLDDRQLGLAGSAGTVTRSPDAAGVVLPCIVGPVAVAVVTATRVDVGVGSGHRVVSGALRLLPNRRGRPGCRRKLCVNPRWIDTQIAVCGLA